MSEHTSSPSTPSHRSDINTKIVVGVGVVSLVLFAIAALGAWVIQEVYRSYLEKQHGVAFPPAVGMQEVGIVDQAHFDEDRRLEKWQAEQKQRLSSYGWVDRGRQLIHVPIERAMEEYVRVANTPPPAPVPAPTGRATRTAEPAQGRTP